MTETADIEDMHGHAKKTRSGPLINIEKLEMMVIDMIEHDAQTRDEIENVITLLRRKYHASPSNSQLLTTYMDMCSRGDFIFDPRYPRLLQSSQVRSNSGVNVVAVTMSPTPFTKADKSDKQNFSCKWNCKFCPDKPGFPRSYVDGEPGVDRGFQNDYDPVAQITDRLQTYRHTGHAADKLEIIVLGGTWASYPVIYQYWFITSLYYGANTFGDVEKREMLDLDVEIKLNETANSRIIGLTLETRPDCINTKELIKFRLMGVTRVQLGMQHINERLLARIDRRCKTQQVIDAVKMLKDNCFKVDIHIMPDLPKPAALGYDNSDIVFTREEYQEYKLLEDKMAQNICTEEEARRLREINSHINELKEMIDWKFDVSEEDMKMIYFLVSSEAIQADQWKLYPCQGMPWSPLEYEIAIGLHRSYVEDKTPSGNRLIDVLLYAQQIVPKWVRINRVIRDIPIKYVQAGCDCSNLQQYLLDIMKKQGQTCRCIRCREVKNKKIDYETAKLCVAQYKASGGDEYFISFEDQTESTLYGFIRLRLTADAGLDSRGTVFDELQNTALIRELHVYGQTIAVKGSSTESSSQHLGFGTRLLQKAEEIALQNGYGKIAVISGVGVREYYRKRGYTDGQFFLLKNLTSSE